MGNMRHDSPGAHEDGDELNLAVILRLGDNGNGSGGIRRKASARKRKNSKTK